MLRIIPDTAASFNNYLTFNTVNLLNDEQLRAQASSNDSTNPTPLPRNLTDLEERLLKFYYKEWLDVGKATDRTLKELSLILKRSPTRISDAFTHLKEAGFVNRKKLVGKGSQKRYETWITCEGFSYSENKPRSQMERQILSVPYIDLSKAESLDPFNLREEQSCEQIIFDHNENIDNKVDQVLMRQKVPYAQRDKIKHDLLSSRIGPVRIEKVITRMTNADKKKPIKHVWAYLRRCIETERRQMTDLFVLLRDKNLPFHEYAT